MIPILAVLILAASAFATDVDKCASGPVPVEVRVAGCASQPCTFSPGKEVNVEVDFLVEKEITGLTPDVKATVLGLTVDYPIPSDACKSLKDAECPLQEGETDTYILSLQIPDIPIESPVDLEFTLTDQGSNTVACFDLKGQVVIDS